jgi:DNA modification methylase
LATLERQPCLFHDPVCVAQDFDDLLIVHHIVERYAPSPPSGGEGYVVPDVIRGGEGGGSTHSTETILWAAKDKKSKHAFNYDEMRADNGGKQMKSVWQFLPPSKDEKTFGKHPTQKPVKLLDRIVRASTQPGDFILDPFSGSSTTGVAALKNERKFCGIEGEVEHIKLSIARLNSATE